MKAITLKTKPFLLTLLAGMVVTAVVLLKNGTTQYNGKGPSFSNNTTKFGVGLFIVGWIGVAYMTSHGAGRVPANGYRFWLPIIASAGILSSVMAMMYSAKKNAGKKTPGWVSYAVGVFALSWIALGYSVSNGINNKKLWFGLLAPILVIISMISVLPWQRKNKVIDGPGFAMFGIAWMFLAMANSM